MSVTARPLSKFIKVTEKARMKPSSRRSLHTKAKVLEESVSISP